MSKYDILSEYRKMFSPLIQEDAVSPAGADGAMGSAPYMDQFQTNPKLAVYNHQTKKKKCFTTEEDMDAFLKENPDWSKEPIEESFEDPFLINEDSRDLTKQEQENLKPNDESRVGKPAIRVDGQEVKDSLVLESSAFQTTIAFRAKYLRLNQYNFLTNQVDTVELDKDAEKILKKFLK